MLRESEVVDTVLGVAFVSTTLPTKFFTLSCLLSVLIVAIISAVKFVFTLALSVAVVFCGPLTSIVPPVSNGTIWPATNEDVPTLLITAKYPSLLLVALNTPVPKNVSDAPAVAIVA